MVTIERKKLEQVLEALDSKHILGCGEWRGQQLKAITAIKEALAQPAQELVGVVQAMLEGKDFTISKPWVGLTDNEIKEIVGPYGDTPIKGYTRKLFNQIEAKLKEKNT